MAGAWMKYVVGAGALGVASYKAGNLLKKPQGFMQVGDPSKDTLTREGFRNASPTKRGLTMLSLSLHKGSPGGTMFNYAGMRIKDTASSLTTPFSLGGTLAGGTAGATAGLLLGAITKRGARMALGGAAMGSIAGAHMARKVQLQVARGVNQARRSVYKKNMYGNQARAGGPGYRTWSNSRTMGKPGHLGMNGSMPFSMHKARHRSTIK